MFRKADGFCKRTDLKPFPALIPGEDLLFMYQNLHEHRENHSENDTI